MSGVIENAIARLYRRVLLTVGRGVINVVDAAGGLQVVQITLSAAETKDNTGMVQEYGFTSNPQPGCQGIAVFVGGDRSNGVVIATNDLRYRLKGLASGEVAIYDDLGQKVHLTRNGIRCFSPISIQHDVNGYGVRTSWNGSGWVIDSYTDTTNVTTNLHAPAPPEIPG